MTNNREVTVLRDLAKQVADIAAKPVQNERRDLWRKHNSFVRTRPPVICTAVFFWNELKFAESLQTEDWLYKNIESRLRRIILMARLDSDDIVEPYLTLGPSRLTPSGFSRWGLPIKHRSTTEAGGSWGFEPALAQESDIDKLVGFEHRIDEEATAKTLARVQDAIGDILPVTVSRAPMYKGFWGDISTDFAQLRGLSQLMLDLVDRPEWVHRVCAFMRDAILRQHRQAEDAGHWKFADGANQAMSYSQDLPDPTDTPAGRNKLWLHMAAQEMAQVSPAMHDEFILQYQLPIMEKFGLIAYGCCEDLTNKIDMLRKIPNLRRIAVSPFANIARCAEQIKTDYIFSWRPSPAEVISNGFKPEKTRKLIREGLEACRGCHVDITLKDVQTIGGNFQNLIDCMKIMRQEAENFA